MRYGSSRGRQAGFGGPGARRQGVLAALALAGCGALLVTGCSCGGRPGLGGGQLSTGQGRDRPRITRPVGEPVRLSAGLGPAYQGLGDGGR